MRLSDLIEQLQVIFLQQNDAERVDTFNRIIDGYCRQCGRALGADKVCHCENDD